MENSEIYIEKVLKHYYKKLAKLKKELKETEDIIKVFESIEIDLDVLGYIDPGITVNIIRNGELVKRKKLSLPAEVTGVIKCKNPRCITSVEQ
jgi:aspartate carbamoyltransferase regulatory subunit